MIIKEIQFNDCVKDLKKRLESCRLNLLIGSGINSDILKTLGNLEGLIEINNLLDNKTAQLRRLKFESLILWVFFKQSIYPIVNNREELKNHIFKVKRLLELLTNLYHIREEKTLGKSINIFTSNYDLIFESALEVNNNYYNDGFIGRLNPEFSVSNFNYSLRRGSTISSRSTEFTYYNLYKIHGSLSWHRVNNRVSYSSDYLVRIEDFYNKYLELFEDYNIEERLISESNQCEDLDQSYKEIIKGLTNTGISNQFSEFIDDFKANFSIVNPSKEKFKETVLNLNYHELLRIYSNSLEKDNSVLIVYGFSFRDEHILSITERCFFNPGLTVVILAYNSEATYRFKRIFQHLNNENKLIIVNCDGVFNLEKFIELFEMISNEVNN